MRHEAPPTTTPHELPDTVQATIDAVRMQLCRNRDALPPAPATPTTTCTTASART